MLLEFSLQGRILGFLCIIMLTRVAGQKSDFVELGEFKMKVDSSVNGVKIYSEPHLVGMASELVSALKDTQIEVSKALVTENSDCFIESFFSKMPLSDIVVIVDLVKNAEEVYIRACEKNKVIHFIITSTELQAFEAFQQAIALINENSKPRSSIIFTSESTKKPQGSGGNSTEMDSNQDSIEENPFERKSSKHIRRNAEDNSSDCSDFFYYDGSECKPCSPNCQSCTSDEECTTCFQGDEHKLSYWKNSSTNHCELCSTPNCQICESAELCSECNPGYSLTEDKLCTQCQDRNCLKCSNDSICDECSPGFIIIDDSCQNCTIKGCQNCSTIDTCDACNEGFYFIDSQCKRCGMNCIECDDEQTCTQCETGFWESSGQCKPCMHGCSDCEQQDVCLNCGESFYIKDEKCSQCSKYCEKCDDAGCLECASGFYMDNNTGFCEPCSEFCEVCSDKSNCLLCEQGVIVNGRCTGCQDHCAACSLTQCLACEERFYFDERSNKCMPCAIGCGHCDSDGCLECQAGFFLDPDTNKCSLCEQGCLFCSAAESCWDCDFGFFLDDSNTCKKCEPHCAVCQIDACIMCDKGFDFDDDNKCINCGKGCESCENNECQKCLPGYFYEPENKTCSECSPGCSFCQDQNSCEMCDEGLYYSQDTKLCMECSANCRFCRDDKTCDECYEGTYVDANKRCSFCAYGCSQCKDEKTCFKCDSGNFKNSESTCTKCQPKCKFCRSKDVCDECTEGYFMKSNLCLPCAENCKECNEEGKCIHCESEFFLTDSGSCSQCSEGCYLCNTPDTCDECQDEFYLDAGTGTCSPCIEGCSLCFDGTSCDACRDGMYVNDFTRPDSTEGVECNECESGCKECSKSGCLACDHGYYKDSISSKCIQCAGNCENCVQVVSDNASPKVKCVKCVEGFYPSNSKCVSCPVNCEKCNESGCQVCFEGFYSDSITGKCTSCIENCEVCFGDKQCSVCKEGYSFDAGLKICTGCKENCQQCKENKFCQLCNEFFYPDSQGNCNKCSDSCVACTASGCSKCVSGFYLDSSKKCQVCSNNCGLCGSLDVCEACIDGFFLSTSDDGSKVTCKPCQDYACSICTESGCSKCVSGFYESDGNCRRCGMNCDACLDDGSCIVCAEGFYVDSNSTCSKCEPGCVKCRVDYDLDDPIPVCSMCDKGLFLDQNSNCKRCTDSNCIKCTDDTKCDICSDFLYPSKIDGKCSACKKNCRKCKDTYTCDSCDNGYYWSTSEKNCKPCGDGCIKCGEKGCNKCYDEFFLDQSSKSCRHCTANCHQCSSFNFCVKPYEGFYFDVQKQICSPCTENCESCLVNQCFKCKQGFYLNDQRTKCLSCAASCISCDKTGCLKCKSGYFNSAGSCSTCESNCDFCESGTKCNECKLGYYLSVTDSEDSCIACSQNCLQCSVDGCISCKSAFYVTDAKQCSSCPSGCKDCLSAIKCTSCDDSWFLDVSDNLCKKCESELCLKCSNEQFCNVCVKGYSANRNGVCKSCPFNCDTCDMNGVCKECSWGFFLNAKGECINCPGYCDGCTSFDFCYGCGEGYYQEKDGTCRPCLRDCAKCTGNSECIDCFSGFYWDEGKCFNCGEGCAECSNEYSCDVCEDGFYYNSTNGNCTPCSDPLCSICSSTECFNCTTGSFPNANTNKCVSCLDNCVECSSTTTCDQCSSTFYLNNTEEVNQCLPCKSTCKTCTSPDVCGSCQDGFYMSVPGTCSKCKKGCQVCDSLKCSQCKLGYFINSGNNCEPCKDKCSVCQNKNICLGCSDGYYADSTGTCQPCGKNCAVCKDPLFCSACNKGYQLTPDNTCSGCSKGCAICDDAGVCSECLNGFQLDGKNKCNACSDTSVVKVQISEDFTKLLIDFASEITNLKFACNKVIKTDSNLGTGWTCSVNKSTLIISFGTGQQFDDKSTFSVYPVSMFTNPCNKNSYEGLTSSFKKQPPSPKGKIKGLPVQSIGCENSSLEFYIDDVTGTEKMSLQVTWKASVTPENTKVSDFVKVLTGTRIKIPSGLFEKTKAKLKLEATIMNPMKVSTVISDTFNVVETKQMTVEIDKGTELSLSSSKPLELNVKIKDACGSVEKSEIQWTIETVDGRRLFENNGNLTTKNPKKLVLDKNFLLAGSSYLVTATVTSGAVTGSASITINALTDELVPVINKQDGNVSPLLNLVIDASESYDPNSDSNQLKYIWNCVYPGTSSTCIGADKEALVSKEYESVLNISANRLMPGSSLNIKVKIISGDDSRNSEKTVKLDVKEGLGTNIEMLFNQDKVEPSEFFVIESKISSDKTCEFEWSQVSGADLSIEINNTPNLVFLPDTLTPGETYEFQLKAQEAGSNLYASSTIKFTVNQPAECVSSLSTSSETGTALSDDFTLSIDSCSDIDETDTPLTYTFYITPQDSSPIALTKAQSFNSITIKLFEGTFTASVKVCDSLGGCNKYDLSNTITVDQNTDRRLADQDPIELYEELITDNEELTIIYAISIMNSFDLTADQVDYIYNSAVAYIETESVDLELIDMMMQLVIQIIENQSSTLTYERTKVYTELLSELASNSTEDITFDIIESGQYLTVSIFEIQQSSIEYIKLANDFLDQITSFYASGLLPGSEIVNTTDYNLLQYKYRDVSSNYNSRNFSPLGDISVFVESLPFDSSDLIDLNVKSFPDESGYSDILEITFTKSGTFKDNNIQETDEEVVELTTSTVLFELPYRKNVTGAWICQYYDGDSWKTGGCEFEEESNGRVKMRISHTTIFRLYDSDKISTSEKSIKKYAPIILICLLALLLIVGYTVSYLISKQTTKLEVAPVQDISMTEMRNEDITEKSDRVFERVTAPVTKNQTHAVSYHLIFGLFFREPWIEKADRILALCLALSTQFVIEGFLIEYSALDSALSPLLEMVVVAAIAVFVSLPLQLVWALNLRKKVVRKCKAATVLAFLVFALNSALVVIVAIELTRRYTAWIICFFWGVLIEIGVDCLVMAGKYFILKA